MTWMRQPNKFIDPNGVIGDYAWTINHSTEDEVTNTRQMGDGAATDDIGLMPQQGTRSPINFHWHGTIFNQTDKTIMDAWYALCEVQSIYLQDFTGSAYEVLITDWNVKRVGVAWNKRGGIPFLWQYTISIRVLKVLVGDWAGLLGT